MKAEKYITNHWEKHKVFNVLNEKMHQERLSTCSVKMEGETFLDFGCAYGHSTSIMSNLNPGKWAGTDVSETAVNEARKYFPEIPFYHFDQIQSDEKKFDGVVCSEVIEHVENDIEFIETVLRLCKKITVFTTPNKFINDPGHLRVYTREDLAEIADKFSEEFSCSIESRGIFFYITFRRRK